MAGLFAASALLYTQLNHYLQPNVAAFFRIEHFALMIGCLAFIGSAVVTINTFMTGQISASRRKAFDDIERLVDSLERLQPHVCPKYMTSDTLFEITAPFHELKLSDVSAIHVKRDECTSKLIDVLREVTESDKKKDIFWTQFMNRSLRLENAMNEAGVDFIRAIVLTGIRIRLANNFFALLATLILVLTLSAFWTGVTYMAFSDAVFVAVCIATIAGVLDFISYEIQEAHEMTSQDVGSGEDKAT